MPRKYVILLAISLSIIALDQWTKWVAVAELTTRFEGQETFGARLDSFLGAPEESGPMGLHYRPRRMVTVSQDFFRFRYAENPGAAFSLFGDLPKNVRGPFFHLITLGAVTLILLYFRRLNPADPTHRWALWGLPLVLGGALGNYIDRLARGFVIDFLEAHWFHRAYWPAFNVADMAICVGVGLMLVDGFLRKEEPSSATAESQAGVKAGGAKAAGVESKAS